MAFNVKNLTNKGRNLQAKAQAGAELKYTKFVFGDGVLGSQSIPLLNNVISPKKTELVTRVFVVPTDQRANVGMYFTNADVTSGFIWREIGLYALDPDDGEILYWYGYDANGTEIPAGGGSEILEQTFDTTVYVGTAQNVSSTIDQSLVFATIGEMQQVLDDSKAYTDTMFANATIPDASLTQKGKVQLTNAINSTSQTLAPTAKAVNDARQAAITDAAADATAKANAAEANAKGASLPRAGGPLYGPIRINDWAEISASAGGYVLYGYNCYLDQNGVVYRYRNTHSNVGAKGIVFRYTAGLEGVWSFDMGSIATTAGVSFTPTLKRLLNTDDLTAAMLDATTKANTAETNAKNASLPRTGGSLSGPLKISSWGTLSAGTGGYFLCGQNCYLDATGTTFRYQNNHSTMGARGFVFRLGSVGAWYFDTGLVATTQDQVFSPTLKRVLNTDEYTDLSNKIGSLPELLTTAKGSTVAAINELFQSGVDAKNGIVGAINANGGSASTSDAWSVLINKVDDLYRPIERITPDINVSREFDNSTSVFYLDIASFPAGTRLIQANRGNSGIDSVIVGSVYDQTTESVILRDSNGLEWVLRTIGIGSITFPYLTIDLERGQATILDDGSVSGYFTTNMPNGFNTNGPLSLKYKHTKSSAFSTFNGRFRAGSIIIYT